MKNAWQVVEGVVQIELQRKSKPPVWALIDLIDLEKVNASAEGYRWGPQYNPHTRSYYATVYLPVAGSWKKRRKLFMSRVILNMDSSDARLADHINTLTLDNRRNNLRKATPLVNNLGRRKSRNNTSGVRGVTWNKQCAAWQARAQIEKKAYHLGYFASVAAAEVALKAFWTDHGFGNEYARAA